MSILRLPALLILVACFFQSCKGDDIAEPDYQASFKSDAGTTALTPEFCSLKPSVADPSKAEFVFSAKSADGKTKFTMSILSSLEIGLGTYETTRTYLVMKGDFFKNKGLPGEQDFGVDTPALISPCYFEVTITKINETFIKGSFVANYLYDRPHNDFLTNVEGSFIARRNP